MIYPLPTKGAPPADIFTWRDTGRYYPGGLIAIANVATAFALGAIYAAPLIVPRGRKIDRLAFHVSTAGAAGSVGRAGIYRNTSDKVLLPSSIMVDGGEFDCTVIGVKAAVVDLFLSPGLYWLTVLFGVAAPTSRGLGNSEMYAILGLDPTNFGAAAHFWRATQAYGPLPATFPSTGLTNVLSQVPVIAVRFT